jgi:hypothetical protein
MHTDHNIVHIRILWINKDTKHHTSFHVLIASNETFDFRDVREHFSLTDRVVKRCPHLAQNLR